MPREEPGSVGECENEHSHSQMNSQNGLSKLQRAIAKVKTPHLEELFISLEIY
jgi:hypothetical protein